MDREELMRRVREQLRGAYNSEDFVQHASQTIDDLDHMLNVMFEHIRNWYSIYLPELKDTGDRRIYLEVVEKYVRDDPATADVLSEAAKKVLPKEKSIGAEISEDDRKALQQFAVTLKGMYDLRDYLDEYRNRTVERIAKNLAYILGPSLATKMIVEAKGLRRLANMPASSIQVLGAEKALFLHLTSHTKPPKHGLLFLHPMLRGVKKAHRGKVARLIAAKVSIAAKADAYTKNFIAPKLKEELEKKMKEIVES